MQDLKKTTELKFTNNLEIHFLGCQSYQDVWKQQQSYLELSLKTKKNTILGLEHPAVATLGYRAEQSDEILVNCPIPIQRTSRGGLATIHSEGQLVIYPVINLRAEGVQVRQYVFWLLECTQRLLRSYGVACYVDEEAVGLFTEKGKIGFCGVRIQNGITQHGLSLNVSNDLELFSWIRSCGVQKQRLDSLKMNNINLSIEQVFKDWLKIANLTDNI